MEAIILPLRISPKVKFSTTNNSRKNNSTTNNSRLSSIPIEDPPNIDISNIEILLTKGNLIRTNILLDDEPSTVICSFLHSLTPLQAALKGTRAACIPASTEHKGALYCVPVEYGGTITTGQYTFSPIKDWIDNNNTAKIASTHHIALRIKNWLQHKHSVPGALRLLFCNFADDRFKYSIINPGFPDNQLSFPTHNQPFSHKSPFSSLSSSSSSPFSSSSSPSRQQRSWQEKVVRLDRCDMIKTNPLFGSNLSFKYKVDRLVTNRGWSIINNNTTENLNLHLNNFQFFTNNNNNKKNKNYCNINNNNSNYRDGDDYSCSSSFEDSMRFQEPSFISNSAGRKFKKQSYPLHHHVTTNNMAGVVECISKGHSPLLQDAYFDTPLHLSAEKGHIDILRYMLDEVGVKLNSINHHGQSLLHVACVNNQMAVLQFLLKRDINVGLKDKNDNTALDACMKTDECYAVLKRYLQQPSGFIDIHLMDSSHRRLMLPSQADTTVLQLHRLMIRELQLPDDCIDLFAIWICSRNLQLQLKIEHRPIQQLNDWKSKIVPQMTDLPPETEDPELYWRRDVLLSIKLEEMVNNHLAIELLFAEAYHNYIKSFYLCSEEDVIFLAGFIMQLIFGSYKENINYFEKEGVLESLVPSHLLPKDTRKSWCRKILNKYSNYSTRLKKNISSIHQVYFLKMCRQLTTYGCAFFIGHGKYKHKTSQIFVGINDVGCQVIETSPRRLSESFKYVEMDWRLVTSTSLKRRELVLRRKGKSKDYVIMSKQVGMMDKLMQRLSNQILPK